MVNREQNALIRFVRRIVASGAAADRQLLERFHRAGDAEAFATIVQRHGPMVFGVCRRLLDDVHAAEDCFQATFLILARRARSVGRPELLGGWLHGVAYRVAMRARKIAARRRARERQVVDVPAREQTAAVVWSDLRPVLDEEVGRLPDKYRLPFVLCYLEGRTNEEAAALLGCPKGTILSRLATARDRLRGRLTRRGITLTAGLLGTMLAENATASVPGALAEATTKMAVLFAAGRAVVSSATVAVLVEGALTTMLMKRCMRMAGALLLAGVLATGLGVFFGAELTAQPEAPEKKADAPAVKAAEAPAEASVADIEQAYRVNDACADERYTGKRVRVTGFMDQVKRIKGDPEAHYRLTMVVSGIFRLRDGIPGAPMPNMRAHVSTRFEFDFAKESRKELAAIVPEQKVTIEGRCEGLQEGNAVEYIRFRDAKLLKVFPIPVKDGKKAQ